MEVTYGAALHLMTATTLFPHSTEGQGYSEDAHSILDEMISQGNMIAAARKTELTHLEGLFRELAAQTKRHGLQALALTTSGDAGDEEDIFSPAHASHLHEAAVDPTLDAHAIHRDSASSPSIPPLASNVDLLNEFGISSYEFQSIIEQIGGSESSILDSMPSWEQPSWEHGM